MKLLSLYTKTFNINKLFIEQYNIIRKIRIGNFVYVIIKDNQEPFHYGLISICSFGTNTIIYELNAFYTEKFMLFQ